MQRLALVLAVLTLAGCGKHGAAPAPSSSVASTSSAAPSSSTNAAPTVGSARPAEPKGACRVLALTGRASVESAPVAVGTLLDGEHWLELEAGASVSLRHTITSRELKLIGPGRALPCRQGREQFLLARGALTTFATLGVRPGAEVLVATPAGIVHYGDADLDLEYNERGLALRVKGGEAWLEPGEPPSVAIKNPIVSGKAARVPAPQRKPSELAAACQSAAETAAESAARLLGGVAPSPSDSLGARAATQMRDRGAARAACSIAAAASGAVADPAERQSLWASIAHSDEAWQSVPRVSARKN